MDVQQSMAMAMDAYNKIFASKETGNDITQFTITTDTGSYRGRWFSNHSLRGFDLSFNRNGRVVNVRFLEQNPTKPSEPGRRAANGARIVWCIERDTNKWLFRIENGQVYLTTEKAVSKVPAPVNSTAAKNVSLPISEVNIETLPEINESLPDSVIRALTENEWDGRGDYGDPELYQ
jgi:hypothetical protein